MVPRITIIRDITSFAISLAPTAAAAAQEDESSQAGNGVPVHDRAQNGGGPSSSMAPVPAAAWRTLAKSTGVAG